MTNPKISVIVTNYNHGQYIKQAVESICKQTFEDWEMIIIDDASTDNSQDVISELEKTDKQRIRAIYQKENKGKWSVLNTAIEQAQGELITLQDCVPPGTMIMTIGGEKPIEEIAPGELVLTHQGHFKKVLKTFKKANMHHEICSIKKVADNRPLKLSYNHPLFAVENDHQKWVKAKDYNKKLHNLAYPILSCGKKYDACIPITRKKNWHHTEIKKTLIDYDFGYLAGLYLGDGYSIGPKTARTGIAFSFNSNELGAINRLSKICMEKFALKTFSYPERQNKKAVRIEIHNAALGRWFEEMFQTGSFNKRLPHESFYWNPLAVRGMLDGYVDSDGSINHGKNKFIKIDSINGALLSQVKLLVTQLGIYASFFEYKNQKSGFKSEKNMFRLSISGKQLEGCTTSVKGSKLVLDNVSFQFFKQKKHWFESKSYATFNKETFDGHLYNIEVEGDNSYVANGIIVHNSDDACVKDRLLHQHSALKAMGSYHNMCGFVHCYTQEDMDKAAAASNIPAGAVMKHADVTKLVHLGHKTPGINHYFVGQDYEVHGASSLFYKQLWTHGMKFLPGNMGLRCQRAEDSDHNTKMTLLLQKTSVLREPLYIYRRNTSTNFAYLENL